MAGASSKKLNELAIEELQAAYQAPNKERIRAFLKDLKMVEGAIAGSFTVAVYRKSMNKNFEYKDIDIWLPASEGALDTILGHLREFYGPNYSLKASGRFEMLSYERLKKHVDELYEVSNGDLRPTQIMLLREGYSIQDIISTFDFNVLRIYMDGPQLTFISKEDETALSTPDDIIHAELTEEAMNLQVISQWVRTIMRATKYASRKVIIDNWTHANKYLKTTKIREIEQTEYGLIHRIREAIVEYNQAVMTHLNVNHALEFNGACEFEVLQAYPSPPSQVMDVPPAMVLEFETGARIKLKRSDRCRGGIIMYNGDALFLNQTTFLALMSNPQTCFYPCTYKRGKHEAASVQWLVPNTLKKVCGNPVQ